MIFRRRRRQQVRDMYPPIPTAEEWKAVGVARAEAILAEIDAKCRCVETSSTLAAEAEPSDG